MTDEHFNVQGVVGFLVALTIACVYLILSFFLMPRFDDLFAHARLPLPNITQAVFSTGRYWNVFGLVALIGAGLIYRSKAKVGWTLIVLSGISILIAVAVFVKAMYAPVLQNEQQI